MCLWSISIWQYGVIKCSVRSGRIGGFKSSENGCYPRKMDWRVQSIEIDQRRIECKMHTQFLQDLLLWGHVNQSKFQIGKPPDFREENCRLLQSQDKEKRFVRYVDKNA